jgi:energy-coupling factor transporter ATP-binding protein EcfA2
MELILNNLSCKTIKTNKNLNNVTYTFKNGITFCSGLSGKLLKELLFNERKLDNGVIMVSEFATKRDLGLLSWNNYNDFNKNNLVDEMTYLNEFYHLNYKDIDKRINEALIMAGLDLKYKESYFSDLSNGELKKVALATMLFTNPKIIILDYYEKNLNDGEINYLKKLIYKLCNMYNKTIIICSDDINCYLNIINNVIIFKEGKIVYEGNNKNLYDDELYKYIDEPPIIKFIKLANEKGHKIDNYVDIKELIKAIYRDVENK